MAEKEEKKVRRPMAEKRAIQSEKRRLINKAFKSIVRTAMKDFLHAVHAKDKSKIEETLNTMYSLTDKCVKRGIFKLGKASRVKSRLTARARAIA